MTALLEATGLVKRFGGTVALDGFDLAVSAGEIAGLVGHNGAGKSTFARVTAGLVSPDAGAVRVDGLNASEAAARVRPILGLAPQELALYPTATARENLFAFAGLYGLSRGEARRHFRRTFPYAVIYVDDPDLILVLAVAHFKRRPGYWIDRLLRD